MSNKEIYSEKVKDYTISRPSYAPLPESENYKLYVEALQGLAEQHAKDDVLNIANSTAMIWGIL